MGDLRRTGHRPRGRVLAKAPFRKIGRRGLGTLQREERQDSGYIVYMLRDFRFESWRDSLCNACRFETRREGTRLF